MALNRRSFLLGAAMAAPALIRPDALLMGVPRRRLITPAEPMVILGHEFTGKADQWLAHLDYIELGTVAKMGEII